MSNLATSLGRLFGVMVFVQVRFVMLMIIGWMAGTIAGYLWDDTMRLGMDVIGAQKMSPAAFGAFLGFIAASFPRATVTTAEAE